MSQVTTIADQVEHSGHFDMNRPSTPSTETPRLRSMIFLDCETKDLPPRDGPCLRRRGSRKLVGESMSGGGLPTGRKRSGLESWAAFPDTCLLSPKGVRQMASAISTSGPSSWASCMTFPGRITPAGDFLGAILDALEGADVQAVGCGSLSSGKKPIGKHTSAAKVFPGGGSGEAWARPRRRMAALTFGASSRQSSNGGSNSVGAFCFRPLYRPRLCAVTCRAIRLCSRRERYRGLTCAARP